MGAKSPLIHFFFLNHFPQFKIQLCLPRERHEQLSHTPTLSRNRAPPLFPSLTWRGEKNTALQLLANRITAPWWAPPIALPKFAYLSKQRRLPVLFWRKEKESATWLLVIFVHMLKKVSVGREKCIWTITTLIYNLHYHKTAVTSSHHCYSINLFNNPHSKRPYIHNNNTTWVAEWNWIVSKIYSKIAEIKINSVI